MPITDEVIMYSHDLLSAQADEARTVIVDSNPELDACGSVGIFVGLNPNNHGCLSQA